MRSRHNRVIRLTQLASLAFIAGTCFQFGGCYGPADIAGYLANFNPCQTILKCNPYEYRFVQAGYEGPGVDPDLDPFCTWPPFCALSGIQDPLSP
ncbi:MAG: hypothetical protein KAY37_12970 [Phycisphaerae bacterium]|nr:hypothetical protein [Phycisphaerae bacterium]